MRGVGREMTCWFDASWRCTTHIMGALLRCALAVQVQINDDRVSRHSRAGGNPIASTSRRQNWVPACAGTTELLLVAAGRYDNRRSGVRLQRRRRHQILPIVGTPHHIAHHDNARATKAAIAQG